MNCKYSPEQKPCVVIRRRPTADECRACLKAMAAEYEMQAQEEERRIASHQQAERLRLDMGQDGCGCSVCQAFYKTIDLTPYKRRVRNYDGVILIVGTHQKREKKEEGEI